jgi:hypothetical protein
MREIAVFALVYQSYIGSDDESGEETMTTLTLSTSYLARLADRVVEYLSDLAEGIREGRELAGRYNEMAHRSDAELRRLGIRREDIPQIVMFGRVR